MKILKVVLFLLPGLALGQVTLSPTLGLASKTSVMTFPLFTYLENSTHSYPFKDRLYVALTPSAIASCKKWNLEYLLGLHYNAVELEYVRFGGVEKPKKFLVDQTLQISYGEKQNVGIGYSLFNTGKSLTYTTEEVQRIQDIQYEALKIFTDFTFKSILSAEASIYYMRNGYPNNRKREAWILGLRLYHTFNLRKSEKSKEA